MRTAEQVDLVYLVQQNKQNRPYQLLVVYAHEIEALRWSSSACGRSISRLENPRETIGSSLAQSHFDQCADHRPDHVFQEPVGVSLDEDLVVVADNREPLETADGILVVREAAFEGRKVLCPDQCRRCLLHGNFIQRFVDVPGEGAIDGGTGRTMEDPIGVELASRIVLGMKAVVHDGRGTNGNVFRQHGIERLHPIGCGPIQMYVKARHLSARMHAGVCAASADDGHHGLADLSDGLFDCSLDRGAIGLALPAGVAGSLVLQD